MQWSIITWRLFKALWRFITNFLSLLLNFIRWLLVSIILLLLKILVLCLRPFFKFIKWIIKLIYKIIKIFFVFENCERWLNNRTIYKKKCNEDAYDIGLTNYCLNDILEMEAVNASLLDRSYLRSLGKLLFLKNRDREVVLPCDKRHFSAFSLKSFGLYLKIQNNKVVRIKMINHIWHEELSLFTETEQDILSFYSHAIPVNLSRQNKILYMKYILYVEGTGWMNRAVKTLTMKTVFKLDEDSFLINPFGEYEFRYQRRTAAPVMRVHKMPKPLFQVLVYHYGGKKEVLENRINKISTWWEKIKKLNLFETYKYEKEEFLSIYYMILGIIAIILVIWFYNIPYFDQMKSGIDARWAPPLRSVYSYEYKFQLDDLDAYLSAIQELAQAYTGWMHNLEADYQQGHLFSANWLDYFDQSEYSKKFTFFDAYDIQRQDEAFEEKISKCQERIKHLWDELFSLK